MKHITEDKNSFTNLLEELESNINENITSLENEKNEKNNNKNLIISEIIDENIDNINLDNDDWLDFQNENDKVREIIMMFKTKHCTSCKDNNSSTNNCFYYHEEKDQRRKPFDNSGKLIYLPNICIFGDQCNKKSSCRKSHNFYEINFHPRVFKTKECDFIKIQNIQEIGKVHNYEICPFFHDINDKRTFGTKVDLKINNCDQQYLSNLASTIQSDIDKKSCKSNLNVIINQSNFKTLKCNNSNKHNEKQCPYYHNSKDKRRPQNTFYYLPEMCFSITSDVKCPRADYCNKCHNQVELFYHNDKFNTKICSFYNEEQ